MYVYDDDRDDEHEMSALPPFRQHEKAQRFTYETLFERHEIKNVTIIRELLAFYLLMGIII